jgi:hypothetical protein
MNGLITRTLLTVGSIWAIVAAIAFIWDRIDRIRATNQPTPWHDPWDCPEGCGQEYGYWCHHLAPEARCPAVNEHSQQCSLCAGHSPETTWPGFAPGHHHDPHSDAYYRRTP